MHTLRMELSSFLMGVIQHAVLAIRTLFSASFERNMHIVPFRSLALYHSNAKQCEPVRNTVHDLNGIGNFVLIIVLSFCSFRKTFLPATVFTVVLRKTLIAIWMEERHVNHRKV